jgi:hypothetical protein
VVLDNWINRLDHYNTQAVAGWLEVGSSFRTIVEGSKARKRSTGSPDTTKRLEPLLAENPPNKETPE